MEPQGTLPHSQELVTDPYPDYSTPSAPHFLRMRKSEVTHNCSAFDWSCFVHQKKKKAVLSILLKRIIQWWIFVLAAVNVLNLLQEVPSSRKVTCLLFRLKNYATLVTC
jgi:hypothetical protein